MIYAIEAGLVLCVISYFLADAYFERRLGVSTVASSKQASRKMLDFIPAGFSGKIVDFGSAWGGLVLDIACARRQASVTGIEFSLFPYLISLLRLKASSAKNLRILREDFFRFSLKDTGIVVCYLPDPMMKNLAEKFRTELPAGALIISHDYPIPDWKPDAEIAFEDMFIGVKIFVYKINESVDRKS